MVRKNLATTTPMSPTDTAMSSICSTLLWRLIGGLLLTGPPRSRGSLGRLVGPRLRRPRRRARVHVGVGVDDLPLDRALDAVLDDEGPAADPPQRLAPLEGGDLVAFGLGEPQQLPGLLDLAGRLAVDHPRLGVLQQALGELHLLAAGV